MNTASGQRRYLRLGIKSLNKLGHLSWKDWTYDDSTVRATIYAETTSRLL